MFRTKTPIAGWQFELRQSEWLSKTERIRVQGLLGRIRFLGFYSFTGKHCDAYILRTSLIIVQQTVLHLSFEGYSTRTTAVRGLRGLEKADQHMFTF